MRLDLQEIVDEAAGLLAAPLTLEDRDFQLVAFAAHPGPVDAVRHASILRRRSTAEVRAHFEGYGIAASAVPVHVPGTGSGPRRIAPRLCLPARARGVTYGYLWAVEDGAAIGDERACAAMRLADRAGLLLARRARARRDVENLLEDLLSPDAEAADRAADDLDARGLARRARPVTVVEVATGDEAGSGAVNMWGLPGAVLLRPHPGGLTLLVPGGHGPGVGAAEQALDLLRQSGRAASAVAGVGDPVPDPALSRQSREQARVAAAAAAAGATLGPVAAWAELGVLRLLTCGSGPLGRAAADPAVARLLAAGAPDLVRTARVWLDAACSPARAANTLAVHRQTLYARLARVEQLTGLALTGERADGGDRLRLHLALTLAPVLASVTVPAPQSRPDPAPGRAPVPSGPIEPNRGTKARPAG